MIKPTGFFEQFLKTQMDGLTGHIEECGYPFNTVCWGEEDYFTNNGTPNWWVYEQTAYWLDGFIRAAILINDKEKIKRASDIIYKVIDKADEDGYLGSKNLKNAASSRWPHVVFFRACLALYEYNKDQKIIDALSKHYLSSDFQYRFFRDVINVEIMLYLYFINKNETLKELAIESYEKYNFFKIRFNQITDELILSGKRLYVHGVTYNEYSKLGALLYKATGNKKYLKVSIKAYETLNKKFLLPGQCNCSDEYTISNYYYETYETCDVSDYTWSNNVLLRVTKDSKYADAIERCVFNAGIGSVLENFRGLQYFSCANQLILDNASTHCIFAMGKKWMSYRPNPGTECCAGNVNRFMPNYIWNMYYQEEKNIYLNLFGSSIFETYVGKGKVKIIEDTNYPFNEEIKLKIETKRNFNLFIRVPKFAKNFSIKINNIEMYNGEKNYVKLKIVENCSVFVKFDTEIEEIEVAKNGVYFRKGALVYSYGMYGDRQIDLTEERSSKEFPAYNIYADKEWGFEVKNDTNPKFYPGTAAIFDIREDLPYIEINAYKIKNAKISNKKSISYSHTDLFGIKRRKTDKGNFRFTPDLLKNEYEIEDIEKKIKLYPYASCKIRETVFKKR